MSSEVEKVVEKELVINPLFEPLFNDNLEDPRYYQVYGGRGCFLKDQEVIMGDSSTKKIVDIKKGDIVKSYNEITKQLENKKVLDTFKYPSHEYIRIKLKNGTIIECTPDHKFLYKGKWKQIQEILKKIGK